MNKSSNYIKIVYSRLSTMISGDENIGVATSAATAAWQSPPPPGALSGAQAVLVWGTLRRTQRGTSLMIV